MKWNFRFKSLLKVRKIITDQAMTDYAAAQSELNVGLKDLDRLYTEVDENYKKTQAQREKGGLASAILKTHDEFFAGQLVRIERQKEKVRQLQQVAEEKHVILVEKSVDQKSIERLEEKDKELFLKERRKQEQIQLDDLVVMRNGRGSIL